MDTQVLILVVSFLLLLVMNVPVAVAIGVSTLLTILSILKDQKGLQVKALKKIKKKENQL